MKAIIFCVEFFKIKCIPVKKIANMGCFVTLCLFLALSVKVNAQSGGQVAPNLTPVSPEASSLGKFVEIPVGLYTGTPELNIPIYTVKSGSLQSVVNLSYHSGGVKLEEIPAWVGSGWTLNAGGAVTRSVRGRPDDSKMNGGFLEFSKNRTLQSIVQMPELARLLLYNSIADNCEDAEPDIYYLNVNGITAKMMFKWNSEGLAVSCDRNIKVAYTYEVVAGSGNNWPQITAWTVIDEAGTVYKFKAQEKSRTYAPAFSGACNNVTDWATTAWYLTEISDVNSENKISFTYDSYVLDYGFRPSETRKFGNNSSSAQCLPFFPVTGYTEVSTSRTVIDGLRIKEITSSNGDVLVSFIPGAERTDNGYLNIPPNGSTSGFRYLDKILIRNGAGNELQTYQLAYDYSVGRLTLKSVQPFNNNIPKSPPFELSYNGALPPMENGPGMNAQDHWGFYNGAVNNTTLIPAQWVNSANNQPVFSPGAYREPDSIAMKKGILIKIKYPTGGYTEFDFEPHEYGFVSQVPVLYYKQDPENYSASVQGNLISVPALSTTNFTVNPNPLNQGEQIPVKFTWFGFTDAVTAAKKPWVKVVNLSSGETIFYRQFAEDPDNPGVPDIGDFYESLHPGSYQLQAYSRPGAVNNVKITADYNNYTNTPLYKKFSGGLRVKEIRQFAHAGDLNYTTRRFSYLHNDSYNTSSGVIYQEPLYTYSLTNYCYDNSGSGFVLHEGRYIVSLAQNRTILGSTQGSHIGYREVQEFWGKQNLTSGKRVTKFTSPFEYSNQIHFELPSRPEGSNSHMTGLQTEQTDFKTGATAPMAVQQTNSSYLFKESTIPALRIMKLLTGSGSLRPEFFLEGDYTNVLGHSKVATVTEKTYSQSSQSLLLTQSNTYEYDADLKNLKNQTRTESNGKQTITAIYYPQDFLSPSPAINRMKELNMLGIPVETIKKIKTATNETIIGGVYNQYSYTGGIAGKIRLAQTNGLKVASPVAGSSFNYSINNPAGAPDIRYEKDIAFTKFDTKGNILEFVAKDQIVTSFIWGYNQQYPVAKIVGKSYDNIIAQSGINLVLLINPLDDASIQSELSKLRTVQGVFVTTYTYKPLVGITCETDPRGRNIYYEYDVFNRLVLVRDHDKNILKKICYNYAGQPEDCNSPCIANWQNTNTPYRCQLDTWGNNTGYVEYEQKDINPCSPTYNQVRWNAEPNEDICPAAITIKATNLSGFDGYIAEYKNIGTGQSFSFSISKQTTPQIIGSLPAGGYTLKIYHPSELNTLRFNAGCTGVSEITGESASFSNILVTQSDCTSITINK